MKLLLSHLALLTQGQRNIKTWPKERDHFSFVEERTKNWNKAFDDEVDQIKSTYRLPSNDVGEPAHKPFHYDVELTMGGLKAEDKNDNGFFEFAADTTIYFEQNTDSKFIVLNAGGIPGYTVDEVITTCNGNTYANTFEHYKEKEMLIVHNEDDSMTRGDSCEIRIKNKSWLPKTNTGLYESSYTDDDGNRHYMATTQFESTGARKMFVCFDEPSLKATFNFSVNYKYPEYTALFNTFEDGDRVIDGDNVSVKYDKTMVMPTYLLALVISDYQIETVSDRSPETNTLVRVPGPEYIHKDKLGEYGLEAAMKVIDGFSEYFGFDYTKSFPEGRAKSDQIGIPDFAAGAMENWGLVTYQYYLIYVNQVDYLESSIASVAEVVAHELTHQWTGNLITCSWWDEIWINEAFADIGGYLGLRYAEPSWNWESEFNTYEMFTALRADALTTSRPIINKQNNDGFVVESPKQISSQFDNIAYAKGGTINRMVIQAMEERRWQDGMRAYLNENAYTATDGEIYFDYMQQSLDRNAPTDAAWDLPGDFNSTFDCWHRQMGYPIIYVKENNGQLTLSQERFLHRGNRTQIDLPASSLNYKWNVPISYVDAADEYKLDWLTVDSDLTLNGYAGKDIWLDPESHAFVRFHYGTFAQFSEVVTNLIKRKTNSLPSNYFLSIAKIVADQWEIATAEIDYGTDIWHVMETTRLVSEHQLAHRAAFWPVWYQMVYIFKSRSTASTTGAVTNAASMNKMMLFSGDRQIYIDYMGNIAGDELPKYMPEILPGDNDHESKMMAKYIVDWHCQLENDACLRGAYDNFRRVRNGEQTWNDINVNIRKFSLNYGVRLATPDDLAWLEDEIFSSVEDEEISDTTFFRNGVQAFSFTKSSKAAIDLLERVRKEAPSQFEYACQQFASQYLLRDYVFDYLTAKMSDIYAHASDDLPKILETACTYIHTSSDEAAFNRLVSAIMNAANGEVSNKLELQIEKCENRLDVNRQWHNDTGAKITLWLRYFGKN